MKQRCYNLRLEGHAIETSEHRMIGSFLQVILVELGGQISDRLR